MAQVGTGMTIGRALNILAQVHNANAAAIVTLLEALPDAQILKLHGEFAGIAAKVHNEKLRRGI